jgi:hypothetical protein
MRALAALLVVAVLGSAGSLAAVARADTVPAEMAAADVTRWLAFWDKLVVTVVEAQASCDKVATDVSALVDKNRDAVAIAKTAHAQGLKLPEAAQQHMLVGVKKMIPAMQKCGQHENVRAAFAKLDVTRK